MRMTLVRTVTISGFAGDANPNVTPPAAGTTFKMQNVPGDQMKDERVEGHRLAIRFVDNANAEVVGPTVDFRTWVKDEDATVALARSAWIGLKQETGRALFPVVRRHPQGRALRSARRARQYRVGHEAASVRRGSHLGAGLSDGRADVNPGWQLGGVSANDELDCWVQIYAEPGMRRVCRIWTTIFENATNRTLRDQLFVGWYNNTVNTFDSLLINSDTAANGIGIGSIVRAWAIG
jgi:hypothetical protein